MLNIKNIGINDSEKLKQSLIDGLNNIYPIESGHKKLTIDKIEFGKPTYDSENWNDIKKALIDKKTIGSPYFVTFNLKDKNTGKSISKNKIRIGLLPKFSDKLQSYIVNGNSYIPSLQFRLKPGAYGRISRTGEAEVFSNIKNSMPIRTQINSQKGIINLKIKQGTVPIYPVLRVLGLSDDNILKTLGKELYVKNRNVNYDNSLKKLYKILYRTEPENIEKAEDKIKTFFTNTQTTPEINKKTLGTPHDTISGQYLLDSAKKVVNITRGKEQPDNRDSLQYKDILGVEDLIYDQLQRAGKRGTVSYKSKYKMHNTDDLDKIVDKVGLNKQVESFFTSAQISRYADQTNPLAMLQGPLQTTLLGQGAIGSPEAVTESAKLLQNTHAGFLDMTHTPESMRGGISLTLAKDTKKEGKQLKTEVINLLNGKTEWLSLQDIQDQPLVFPGEFTRINNKWIPVNKKIFAIKNDKKVLTNPALVKYMISKPSGMFDIASNLTPFMQSNQGNRLLTSAKMALQAIPLVNPEKPLVENYIDGVSLLDDIGDKFSVKSDVNGTVQKVTPQNVYISTSKGLKKIPLLDNIPLNDGSLFDSKIKVKVGDKIIKGQLLADSPFTKDGKYTSGVNLVTAYIPWKGKTYEDASVITEGAAKKLSSLHLYKKTLPISENIINDLNKFHAYQPYSIEKMNLPKYDDMGVIKPGAKVKPHDILAASLKKNVVTGADTLIEKLKKSAVKPLKDNSLEWDKETEGEVINVSKHKKGIDIYVKTTEPLQVADKLSGRHGNKTTISEIIPDELAPKTKDGKKIEWILDPSSVPSRINLGQILETAAGKVASKTGKTFKVENFSGKDYRKEILGLMKQYNIPEKEDIFDPVTGKTLPQVFVGNQYVEALKHKVGTKSSSLGISGIYTKDNSPIAGGGKGGQALDNLTSNVLLASNSRALLRDMYSIKNNPHADYWRAIQHGEIPPAPATPFEYSKFNNLLKGMGVNMVDKESAIKLSPLTDKQILNLSRGEIKNPIKTFTGKGNSLNPDKNGLFGTIPDGFRGENFSHIKLDERIPAPAYKDAIKNVLNLTEKKYNEFLNK